MTSAILDKQTQTSPVSAGEDDMRQYLHEIRQFPRLTAEEERLLAKRCAEGDEEAVRQMVNSNLRLVVSVAKEYAGRGVALLDLIQEGSIGLLIAARKFDYRLDFRFSTYATKWIRQGVTRCLMNQSGLIRVPLHTGEKMRKVLGARASLIQENGQEPTPQEIGEKTGIASDKVSKLLQMIPEICSLDVPAGEDEDTTLGTLLEDLTALQPQEELVRQELKHIIDSLLSELNERQQQVLRLHYGMDSGKCLSLEEIGNQLGISKERARQIEKQAMDKLRANGREFGLEDFLG